MEQDSPDSPARNPESPIQELLRDDPADEALDRLIHLAASALAVPGALLGLVDGDRQVFKSAVGLPEPWATRRERPLADTICRFVLAAGKPLAIKDTSAHPGVRGDPAIRELGMAAYAGFPLRTSTGQLLGTVCAWDHGPRVWTGPEVRTLRDVAGVIALEVERRLGAAAEGRGSARAGIVRPAALEQQSDGLVELDAEWRITYVNRAAEAFFGRPREALIGRDMRVVFPALAEAGLFRELERTASGLAAREFEGFCPHPNAWLEVRAYPAGSGLAVYFRDITERKLADREAMERAGLEGLRADIRAVATDREASLGELLRRCAREIAGRLDAAYVRIWMVNAAEDTLELQAGVGAALPAGARHDRIPIGRLKVGMIALQREPSLTNDVLGDPHLGEKEWARREGIVGFAGCPITLGKRIIGVVAIFSHHLVTGATLELLAAAAAIIAQPADRKRMEENARRLTAEPAAAPAAGQEAPNFQFLAEASELLDASLDYEITLASVARLLVPGLADLCLIDIVEEDGTVRRLEGVHADPAKEELVRALRRYSPGSDQAEGPGKALRTGEPELIPEAPASFLAGLGQGAEHLDLMRRLEPKSVMIVPLVAHGHTLGAITLITAESGRRYGPADLELALDVARRAALATDNARLYRHAREAHMQAEAAVRWRDQVLAIVSHDLKNPLSLIFTAADLLGQKLPADPYTTKQLHVIRHSADQMNRLIGDLLDVATIEAGQLSLVPRDEDVAGLLIEACELFRLRAEERRTRLDHEIEGSAGIVYADRRRLLQVLSNVIGNALEFTPESGRITIRAERAGGDVLFSVADTGRGIAAEHLPYLFERFWQAERTGRRGAGLGLTIARGIVEAHGGRIWAESEPGQGSTFYFTIPGKG